MDVVLSGAAASYTLFFKECFDHKFETELSHGRPIGAGDLKLHAQSVHERMKNRPPAALPPPVPATAICTSSSNR